MKNKTAIARERFRDLEDFGGRSPRERSPLIEKCALRGEAVSAELLLGLYLFSTTSSSRRFFARPSSVSLDATGLSGP